MSLSLRVGKGQMLSIARGTLLRSDSTQSEGAINTILEKELSELFNEPECDNGEVYFYRPNLLGDADETNLPFVSSRSNFDAKDAPKTIIDMIGKQSHVERHLQVNSEKSSCGKESLFKWIYRDVIDKSISNTPKNLKLFMTSTEHPLTDASIFHQVLDTGSLEAFEGLNTGLSYLPVLQWFPGSSGWELCVLQPEAGQVRRIKIVYTLGNEQYIVILSNGVNPQAKPNVAIKRYREGPDGYQKDASKRSYKCSIQMFHEERPAWDILVEIYAMKKYSWLYESVF